MKRNWKRKLYGGLCLTSIAFVFQACYGTPQDFGADLLLSGQVKSKTTGLPIKGIKVSVIDGIQYSTTDANGNFSFYTEKFDSAKIRFEDIDSTLNGSFVTKDSVLTALKGDDIITLKIELEEK